MKQIWSPYVVFKFFADFQEGELLSSSLPHGIYCTENFTWGELLLNQRSKPSIFVLENLSALANRLQAFRDTIFKKSQVIVTSAWRDEKYNKKIGGASGSKHILGQAADIYVKGMPPSAVQLLLKNHSGGLGCYKNFTHVDIGKKRRW